MIRPYDPSDLEGLLDVWHRASVVAHSFLPAEFFPKERRMIAEVYLPQSETWVAEIDHDVVGFISLVDQEVGGLFVDPARQRMGIGRALLAKARGVRPILELGVFEANSDARRFYASCGFVEVGRSVDEEVGHAEIRMRLDPSDASPA